MKRILPALILILFATGSSIHAGYEMPSYVDGCRSMDGRFEISVKQTVKANSSHGPNKWSYIWKDLKTGETNEFAAQGIQGGQRLSS
ncbi:MAG: hypothetical protein COA78_27755 [Blastopirellula sp.]|nr:MAG: hypothetical protein COA78_27755 [Blastopirellula sp.]